MTTGKECCVHEDMTLKESVGRKVTYIGMFCNLFLAVLKLVLGIMSRSAALVADAIHSLSDLVTDFVCIWSLKHSEQPEDEEHPYGHGRIESFGTAVIGVLLVVVGVGIIISVVEQVLTSPLTTPTPLAIVGAVVSILVKEGLFQYTKREGMRIKSKVVIANAWHHRTDSISSFAALVGIVGAQMGYPLLDPISALVVSAIIIKTGSEITSEAYADLIDTSASEEVRKQIMSVIINTDGVRAFHDLRSRLIGGKIWLEVHIVVQPRISITEGHTIAELVKSRLMNELEEVHDVIVHADAEDDREAIVYDFQRKKTDAAIKEIVSKTELQGVPFRSTIHYLAEQQELELKFVAHSLPQERQYKALKEVKAEIEKQGLFHKVAVYLEVA